VRFDPCSPLAILGLAASLLVSDSPAALGGLDVSSLGRIEGMSETDEQDGSAEKWRAVQMLLGADGGRVAIQQVATDLGGNTSVRNNDPLEWKERGYYQRNRDLGQVFTAESAFTMDALVLRTGPDTAAFLEGSAGTPVFIQLFAVEGEPVIHDNGTPVGSRATHGFSTNHRCDDYVTGVRYRSIGVVTGGVLPDLTAGGDGRLVYMKWDLTEDDEPTFEAGRRYAFMIGIEEPGPERGFTLANRNNASSPEPPSIADSDDTYHGGWGLRREGNGRRRSRVERRTEPSDAETRDRLKGESSFPGGDLRYAIPPTCDGYPDVDTYRDLEFYVIRR